MNKESRILVLGHKGLVGSAVIRELEKQGYENVLTAVRDTGNRFDLRDPAEVNMAFHYTKPEYVFLCAAKVGGILMNDTQSGDMIHEMVSQIVGSQVMLILDDVQETLLAVKLALIVLGFPDAIRAYDQNILWFQMDRADLPEFSLLHHPQGHARIGQLLHTLVTAMIPQGRLMTGRGPGT